MIEVLAKAAEVAEKMQEVTKKIPALIQIEDWIHQKTRLI